MANKVLWVRLLSTKQKHQWQHTPPKYQLAVEPKSRKVGRGPCRREISTRWSQVWCYWHLGTWRRRQSYLDPWFWCSGLLKAIIISWSLQVWIWPRHSTQWSIERGCKRSWKAEHHIVLSVSDTLARELSPDHCAYPLFITWHSPSVTTTIYCFHYTAYLPLQKL